MKFIRRFIIKDQMSKQLRPYQKTAVQECWQALRKDDNPVLLMASVGSGKSLMISDILIKIHQYGKRALCLVNNAELVRNNCATFNDYGGHGSIWCAQLDRKDCSASIVFGTPQSVLNGITKNKNIADVKFNFIIVDEAHNISHTNHRSCFMRILRHYKQKYNGMRVLGATGTAFRFKGSAIVGNDCLFKSQVGNITTSQLIDDGYLIKPTFQVDPELVIDFSCVRIKSNGQFDSKQLAQVIDENTRLTELICKQVVHIVELQARFGCFMFATTRKHAQEIMSHLPPDESALILGDTPQAEREIILNKARAGSIKYLVNISIISVGVDIPSFDTIAYLRPTESLVLLVQTMGRALRLSPTTDKKEALILDFAQNIQRHQDWDDPILLEAVKQTDPADTLLDIQCPQCQEWNPLTTRRCRGIAHNKRCDYYFEWKDCTSCGVQNDIASRHCRTCEAELIDPNAKLSLEQFKATCVDVKVLKARYYVHEYEGKGRLYAEYHYIAPHAERKIINESYSPMASEKAKNFFYGKFVKESVENSSEWYPQLQNLTALKRMLNSIKAPTDLTLRYDGLKWTIWKRYFHEDTIQLPTSQHLDQSHIPQHSHEPTSEKEIPFVL